MTDPRRPSGRAVLCCRQLLPAVTAGILAVTLGCSNYQLAQGPRTAGATRLAQLDTGHSREAQEDSADGRWQKPEGLVEITSGERPASHAGDDGRDAMPDGITSDEQAPPRNPVETEPTKLVTPGGLPLPVTHSLPPIPTGSNLLATAAAATEADPEPKSSAPPESVTSQPLGNPISRAAASSAAPSAVESETDDDDDGPPPPPWHTADQNSTVSPASTPGGTVVRAVAAAPAKDAAEEFDPFDGTRFASLSQAAAEAVTRPDVTDGPARPLEPLAQQAGPSTATPIRPLALLTDELPLPPPVMPVQPPKPLDVATAPAAGTAAAGQADPRTDDTDSATQPPPTDRTADKASAGWQAAPPRPPTLWKSKTPTAIDEPPKP